MSVGDVEPFKPHGFTIFCEDLREEASGQTTYVGVYGDAMFVDEELPIQLPQLCMAIHLFDEPREGPQDLTISVAQPGEEFEDATVKIKVTPEFNLLTLPDIGDKLTRPRAHVVLKAGGSPYIIKRFGRVRVQALWNGVVVPLGSLAIAPPKSSLSDDPPSIAD